VAIFCGAIFYFVFVRLLRSAEIHVSSTAQPRVYEKVFAYVSLITYALQFYYKVSTGKGLFMLNPCHINVLIMSYLALKPTTQLTKTIALCWEAWFFGPLLSLMFPHLSGLENQLEVKQHLKSGIRLLFRASTHHSYRHVAPSVSLRVIASYYKKPASWVLYNGDLPIHRSYADFPFLKSQPQLHFMPFAR